MKNKFARFISLALAVLMMLAVVAACGGSGGQPAQTTAAAATTAAPATTAAAATTTAAPTTEAAQEITEYSILMCWNGGAASWPDGFENSLLAEELWKKTGVRLKPETITSSEREKLAMVFASGDVPDITNAPHWNTNPGGEGELIKNAGKEGLLLPLANEIPKYPNIARTYAIGTVSQVYLDQHIKHPEYNGEIYVIPTQVGRSKDDTFNWSYNLFGRQDILDDLGLKATDINSQEALYDFLRKIKDGNYVDANGRPVIPAGNWHNGWDYNQFLTGWHTGNVTGWAMDDGKLVNQIFLQREIDRTLFMRRLVEEGIMDPESFTQTDTMAREKMVTGRVAVFGCHYPNQYGFFKTTSDLYTTNPEMKFVPLGPIMNLRDEHQVSWSRNGRNGSPVLFFSSQIKDKDKALSFIDYTCSDEGILHLLYGLEGEHYTMVDGIPTYTDKWQNIKDTDNLQWNLAGFGMGENLFGSNPSISKGWNRDYMEEGYLYAREINPLKFYDGFNADDIVNMWEGKATYDEKMSIVNWGDELKKAFLSSSDDEAVAIIEAHRKRMMDNGYQEMEDFLNQRYSEDNSTMY